MELNWNLNLLFVKLKATQFKQSNVNKKRLISAWLLFDLIKFQND